MGDSIDITVIEQFRAVVYKGSNSRVVYSTLRCQRAPAEYSVSSDPPDATIWPHYRPSFQKATNSWVLYKALDI